MTPEILKNEKTFVNLARMHIQILTVFPSARITSSIIIGEYGPELSIAVGVNQYGQFYEARERISCEELKWHKDQDGLFHFFTRAMIDELSETMLGGTQ